MRIGIDTLAAHRKKTGIGTYISSLVNSLLKVDRENRYTLFVSRENAIIFPGDGPNCQKVFGPQIINNTNLRVLWEHTVLPFKVRQSQVDLLHGPTFVTPFLSNVPSVVTIHDMTWFTHPDEHVPLKRGYYQSLIPVAARRAERVIAITESTRKDILRILDVPEEKVVTVHYGVDDIFQPVRDQANLAEIRQRYGIEKEFVLFVGMLEPRKNLVRIVEAFGELKKSGFEGWLVMAGPQGWGYEETAAKVRQLGLEEYVLFIGPVPHEELPALFSAADLLVYPSLYEGFGLPPLEAMACGTPVIASNISSLPEVTGDAGLLVDPLDVSELAEAMRRVLTDGELRQRMRAKGLERAKRFTWEETARRTLRVYEEAYILAQDQVETRGDL